MGRVVDLVMKFGKDMRRVSLLGQIRYLPL